MSKQIIKLSDKAVLRIKEIMSQAQSSTIGVRVGVKVWRLCRNDLHYGICIRY